MSERTREHSRFWISARRLLQYEEPIKKWSHLRRLAEAAQNFVPTEIDRTFSRCFALMEVHAHSEEALSLWKRTSTMLYDIELPASISSAVSSAAALSWSKQLASIPIPWTALSVAGEETEDAAREFVGAMLSRLSSTSTDAGVSRLQDFIAANRGDIPSEILPQRILLVEGLTERILLPHVAQCMGKPFEESGLKVEAAGGANRVNKRYMQLRSAFAKPILCLLDSDAVTQIENIRECARAIDKLLVVDGEIEDTIDSEFFTKLLNEYLASTLAVAGLFQPDEVRSQRYGRNSEIARELLRRRASVDFDKVQFARIAVRNMLSADDVPQQLKDIVDNIMDCSPHQA